MWKANRRRHCRPVRLAAIAGLSILVIATLFLVLVRLGTFDRLILAEASGRLEAMSGLVLEAEKIDIDPFRLSLSLRKPTLHAGEGQGPVLRKFTAESIDLDIPLSVRRRAKIREGPHRPARGRPRPDDARPGTARGHPAIPIHTEGPRGLHKTRGLRPED